MVCVVSVVGEVRVCESTCERDGVGMCVCDERTCCVVRVWSKRVLIPYDSVCALCEGMSVGACGCRSVLVPMCVPGPARVSMSLGLVSSVPQDVRVRMCW